MPSEEPMKRQRAPMRSLTAVRATMTVSRNKPSTLSLIEIAAWELGRVVGRLKRQDATTNARAIEADTKSGCVVRS